ncbi:MAG: hypothetical protein NWT04_16045 [Verrucomicrobiales bacterium]|jgi:hypothetical protein|nr:hypothetical protein [Verrucomicrobiales bacterium]MDP4792306.1 hypothetical protein [Verrucomicrobiales bacterium]MDP5004518.1 hypothetical protein [Verrucomicrobiales bacterium]
MEGKGEKVNEALEAALASRSLRFFRAGRDSAKGRTGPEDTGRFADNLMVLQECALLLGEKLEMNAVSHALYYEGDETAGFCFDPNSSLQNPNVAGAMVNRRMPMNEFISSVRDYINS